MGLWIFQVLYTWNLCNICRKTVFLRSSCTLQGSSLGLERIFVLQHYPGEDELISVILNNLQMSCFKNVASLVWWVPKPCIFEHVAMHGVLCSSRGIWECVWWSLKYCNNGSNLQAFRGELSFFSGLIISCAIFKAGIIHRSSEIICFMHYLKGCCIKKAETNKFNNSGFSTIICNICRWAGCIWYRYSGVFPASRFQACSECRAYHRGEKVR